MSDAKGPIDRLLDTFVYAPIGLLLNLDEVVPQLIEKGHQQVNMARMFGQFAVEGEGKKQAQKLQAQARTALSQLTEQAAGFVAGATTRAGSPAPAAPAPVVEAPSTNGAAAAEAATEPAPAHDELAITDYDSLSASQVVPRLEGLSAAELDGVRRYEAAHRGRKTILSKIAQLG